MTLVVAHRGASAANPPGNTPAAFAASASLGADWVELDVHCTADGGLAVHHDPHLVDGRILGEMKAADLPDFVPLLSEVLELTAGIGVNVEIKPDGILALRPTLIDGVVSLLESFGDSERFLVTSFDLSIINSVRSIAPSIATGFLVVSVSGDGDGDAIAVTAAQGHKAINPWHALVDAEVVRRAHDHGLEVNVWTVDDPERMRELIEFGVDAIITNVPDVCRAVIDAG